MQLEIIQENKIIDTVSLQPGIYNIGRGKDNDIYLTDTSVSRNHARLEISRDFQVRVVDVNSSNGTWLDNSRITSEIWSGADAVLEIGNCRLVLRTSDSRASSHQSLLPGPQSPLAPVLPLEQERQQQQVRQVEKTAGKVKQPQQRKTWETATLLAVILLISPFVAFLGKNILLADATLVEVESEQREKDQLLWQKKKKQGTNIELATVRAHITNESYDPALSLVRKILQENPENSQALELQKKINEKKSKIAALQEKRKEELARKNKEKKRHEKEQRLKMFKQQIETMIVEKNFTGCIETAQKLLVLDPTSEIATSSIAFCGQSLTSNQSNKEDAIELEKKKLLSRLKKIHKKGTAAVKAEKFEDAIRIWSQARSLDPDRIFDISKKIRQDSRKTQEKISNLVETNISKGKKASEQKNHLAALAFFETALSVKPSDKEAKQLYETQMKRNHILAEELYLEAIAYASLDSLDNAKNAIEKARSLAEGNADLLQRIDENIADLNKR